MILEGKLLSAERSNGTFKPDDGRETIAYDNWVYRVLDGDRVRKVKVKADQAQPSIKAGDDVRLEVSCSESIALEYRAMAPAAASPLHKVG
jgi:hypothetical protein